MVAFISDCIHKFLQKKKKKVMKYITFWLDWGLLNIEEAEITKAIYENTKLLDLPQTNSTQPPFSFGSFAH